MAGSTPLKSLSLNPKVGSGSNSPDILQRIQAAATESLRELSGHQLSLSSQSTSQSMSQSHQSPTTHDTHPHELLRPTIKSEFFNKLSLQRKRPAPSTHEGGKSSYVTDGSITLCSVTFTRLYFSADVTATSPKRSRSEPMLQEVDAQEQASTFNNPG
jgi:hypothetical protein